MALSLTSSIGALQFHGWVGRLTTTQNQGEDFARLGQKGSGSQVLNVRAKSSTIQTWRLFDTMASAVDFVALVEALQWTVVATNDPVNGPRARVRVIASAAVATAGRGTPSGAGSTPSAALVRCEFTLETLP